ncbi:DNA mismatch repair protein MutS [Syntrophothermus lipocalidus]|uniref:DNA mismatch repair protein MutS n=1 Tax=Syntrophothermus lipocalidus (strain DSM 12680 / TGB-C1) TaxID=643648 RepID=D7CMB6_SYNLT|nr:DNA mismatch repair protein MutS [Syntrophothermus lipocalidus]ADI01851.1 DNA mismatch repair protein MutS [Syntrophothermus lipocalidus DSM 12680]
MTKLTPMMEQYRAIKEQYPDCILFFRLGDFYEMFFEDAEIAAQILEIVLTARDGGSGVKVPMCGVPFHAADTYISRLIAKGYRVAICEQVEDPALTKGLVKREVVRVITPGTVVDVSMLEAGENNYLVALAENESAIGLAVIDVSTGDFQATEVSGPEASSLVLSELYRLRPAECLIPAWTQRESILYEFTEKFQNSVVTEMDPTYYQYAWAEAKLREFFEVEDLVELGLESCPAAVIAAAVIVAFLESTCRAQLKHLSRIRTYQPREYLGLDVNTRRNLELTRNLKDGKREGSLLAVIDCCRTAMGRRLLQRWLEQPLVDVKAINERLDAVEEMYNSFSLRERIREILGDVHDIERLAGRIGSGVASPRELLALKNSLINLPAFKALLPEVRTHLLKKILELDTLEDVYRLLDSVLDENAPASIREGGIIKPGCNPEVDELRKLAFEGKEWLLEYEQGERERTGIKSLKLGFNRVFGYFIEVTKPNVHLVPSHYVRKQTLVNAERYITDDLKNYEEKVLSARERLVLLEQELFQVLREEVACHVSRLQEVAGALAKLDVIACLAETAFRHDYVRPLVDDSDVIFVKNGRHPVVERFLGSESFVPNDTYLDDKERRLAIITGPNMGGKSTYMRQVALITILAQVGSFVPATEARIGVVDQVFTRVGASDDLVGGQSTFMVEMVEVAHILKNATRKSLVILDEIGRGTSTFDGMSIAQAVLEHICSHIGAKTLFATHYHELTGLDEVLPGVFNLSVSVKESAGAVIFLKKVIPGRADKSYGIQVAGLAGLPVGVIQRAGEILRSLESKGGVDKVEAINASNVVQLALFQEEHPLVEELKQLELDDMTPLEALQLLYRWREQLVAPSKKGKRNKRGGG